MKEGAYSLRAVPPGLDGKTRPFCIYHLTLYLVTGIPVAPCRPRHRQRACSFCLLPGVPRVVS